MKKKAKDLFRKIFPKSRFADSLNDEDLGEVNEEELGGASVEAAEQAATEAKEAASQALEAAQKASEIAENISKGSREKLETDEEGNVDIKAVMEKLNKLEELVMKLVGSTTDEGETEEEKAARLAEEEKKKKESQDADEEEILKKKEDEELENEFQDVAANAEIIDPGIMCEKPTKDFKSFYRTIKKTALKRGLVGDCKDVVRKALKKKTVDSLKDEELDIMFLAVSGAVAATRDAKVHISRADMKIPQSSDDIATINKRNKEFWSKK